jgi:hypothetical protein
MREMNKPTILPTRKFPTYAFSILHFSKSPWTMVSHRQVRLYIYKAGSWSYSYDSDRNVTQFLFRDLLAQTIPNFLQIFLQRIPEQCHIR